MELTKKVKDAAQQGTDKVTDLGKEAIGKGREEVEKVKMQPARDTMKQSKLLGRQRTEPMADPRPMHRT
jgi:hypothetical protein